MCGMDIRISPLAFKIFGKEELPMRKTFRRRLALLTLLACFSILSVLSASHGSVASASIIRYKPICGVATC